MRNVSRILWGLMLLAVGVIILLNSLDITSINIFFKGWWTLFIIVPSTFGLITEREKVGNGIMLAFGVFLLLACRGIINFSDIWKMLLPVILILLGISIIFKDIIHGNIKTQIDEINKKSNGDNSYCSTFANQKVSFDGEEFKGCDLDAVFGGIEVDLRGSKIKNDVVINISCIFGGVDIKLPEDVNVKVSSTPIFGGVSNKHYGKVTEKSKTVYIDSKCIFGGVELK